MQGLETGQSKRAQLGVAASFDEAQTLERAAAGDLAAFNQLVLLYQNLAYSVAYRTLLDEAAAADVVQESFLKVYRDFSTFQGGSFKSWLTRIVANSCYDWLRARRRHPTANLDDLIENDEYAPYFEDRSGDPQTQVEQAELHDLLERALAALPADQRLAITLCDVHGYSYEEIAEIADIPIGTVKSRINRARSRVRTFLLRFPELLPATFRPY